MKTIEELEKKYRKFVADIADVKRVQTAEEVVFGILDHLAALTERVNELSGQKHQHISTSGGDSIPPRFPGWEWTGEYRGATEGEYFLADNNFVTPELLFAESDKKHYGLRYIYRKLPPKPEEPIDAKVAQVPENMRRAMQSIEAILEEPKSHDRVYSIKKSTLRKIKLGLEEAHAIIADAEKASPR